ncbi:hypothetical protein H4R19_005362 [Coemansia spiralis]|nr:hypothetical protein H4R19_005362 [Coemansia spiralis]
MPASVKLLDGADGSTERVVLCGPDGASAEVYLYGATITSWTSRGVERLFVSAQAKLDGSRPIRGGIPLVFPQFGPGELPQHGFARTRKWVLVDSEARGVSAVANLELRDDEDTRASKWPYAFSLRYTITLTATTLSAIMKIENFDDREFSFTALQHTYFRVADIATTTVTGLDGAVYADKVRGTTGTTERRAQVTVAGNEDRVYADVPGTITVGCGKHRVRIQRFNFKDIVLWNPWADKSAEMSDFGDSEYKTMICVEPGAVAKPVTLRPAQMLSCGQLLTVDDAADAEL